MKQVRLLRRWLLVAAFILLMIALFQWDPAQQLFQSAEEQGIDTGAYFYTETEVSYQSESYIRESLEFTGATSEGELAAAVVIGASLFGLILWLGYKYVLKE